MSEWLPATINSGMKNLKCKKFSAFDFVFKKNSVLFCVGPAATQLARLRLYRFGAQQARARAGLWLI